MTTSENLSLKSVENIVGKGESAGYHPHRYPLSRRS